MKDIGKLNDAELEKVRKLLKPINCKDDEIHFCKVVTDSEDNQQLIEEVK